jgi:hypothetical protein
MTEEMINQTEDQCLTCNVSDETLEAAGGCMNPGPTSYGQMGCLTANAFACV